MSPPIEIDGTDITGATIDGTDVQEITVDGQTVFTAVDIPDTAVHHYDVSQLSGFSEGQTVSTISDQIGSADLTGTGTYRETALNGNPAVEIDGNFFDASTPPISTPNTIYLVGEFLTTNDTILVGFEDADSSKTTHNITSINGNIEIFAGSALTGSSDLSIQQTTSLFDGANSILREEGTQTASGDTGNRTTAENLRVGARATDGNFNEEAYFSELVICDGDDVDQSFESSLLSKWGISA